MKFTTLSRRTTAAGAASALVAGALVGATTTAAEAAPVQNTYTCDTPVGPVDITLNSDAQGIEGFDGILNAGANAPAGALTVLNVFTISDEFHQTLVDFGIENLTFPDFSGDFGNSSVPLEGMTATVSDMVDNANGTWSTESDDFTDTDGDPAEGVGVNGAFKAPAGGDHDVLAPGGFTIRADLNGSPVDVVCSVQGAPQSYATLTVNKNDTKNVAKAVNSPVKKGDVAKVKVKVTDPNGNVTPSGTVVLKKGIKTLDKGKLNAKGVVVLKFTAKTLGKNKLKALYKGDGYTNKSSDNVVVKVIR